MKLHCGQKLYATSYDRSYAHVITAKYYIVFKGGGVRLSSKKVGTTIKKGDMAIKKRIHISALYY